MLYFRKIAEEIFVRVKNFFSGLVGFVEDLLFPEYACFICGREAKDQDYHMCDECKKTFPFIKGELCFKCGHPVLEGNDYCDRCRSYNYDFDEARAVFEYDKETKGRILGIKYNNQKYLAKFFARLMLDTLIEWGIDVDFIIPVPISRSRRRERGFNQTELIAYALEDLTGLPVMTKIVAKKDDSKIQKDLGLRERFENMKGMFELDKRYNLKGKNILIVDDVFTTGATVSEISRTLRKSNPNKVYVLTAGKTLMRRDFY